MPKLDKPVENEDERKRKLEGVAEIFRNKYGVTIARGAKRHKSKTRQRS